MAHRIREAMCSDDLNPMGGGGGMVEADETFIGRKKGAKVSYELRAQDESAFARWP